MRVFNGFVCRWVMETQESFLSVSVARSACVYLCTTDVVQYVGACIYIENLCKFSAETAVPVGAAHTHTSMLKLIRQIIYLLFVSFNILFASSLFVSSVRLLCMPLLFIKLHIIFHFGLFLVSFCTIIWPKMTKLIFLFIQTIQHSVQRSRIVLMCAQILVSLAAHFRAIRIFRVDCTVSPGRAGVMPFLHIFNLICLWIAKCQCSRQSQFRVSRHDRASCLSIIYDIGKRQTIRATIIRGIWKAVEQQKSPNDLNFHFPYVFTRRMMWWDARAIQILCWTTKYVQLSTNYAWVASLASPFPSRSHTNLALHRKNETTFLAQCAHTLGTLYAIREWAGTRSLAPDAVRNWPTCIQNVQCSLSFGGDRDGGSSVETNNYYVT